MHGTMRIESMENCELPIDVVFQILLVLPVVSLLRFRSVSKYWKALIDSSTFITRHRLLHEEHDDSIIAQFHENKSWYLLSVEPHLCVDISAQLHHFREKLHHLCDPEQEWESLSMVGSCHGLICMKILFQDRVTLWNPARRQLTLLPKLPVPTDPERSTSIYGFGYAITTNCYKVIKLTQIYNHDRGLFDNTRVEIYNLQSDSWRTDNVDIKGEISIHEGVYWNGLYYQWITDWPAKNTFSLISFDLSDEVLGVVAFPDPEVLSTRWFPRQLFVVSECIAFVDDLSYCNILADQYFNIWVLKEFGIKESWTKLYTIGPTTLGRVPAGFFSKGDFFFFTYMETENEDKHFLAWCNPIIQEIQYLPAHPVTRVFTYKESLVSVKKGNGASCTV